WAWEFVTQRLELPTERLWITIFLDDDEAFGYWREEGIPEARILRFGEDDNFWGPAGETGPCGPCSEIHYDLGPGAGCGKPECGPNCECGRFIEIWNLVFTQYDQQKDGRRPLLPKPNIDTGMGLERTAAAIQGKPSVYETDLIAPLIEQASRLAGKVYGKDETTDRALRIVAEHGRAVTFLIGDGIMPSNEGRGYVLRRVLRRAALFGRKLGLEEPFLGKLAQAVISQMGDQYPELVKNRDLILNIIEAEEERFNQTLDKGIQILEGMIAFRREIPKELIGAVEKELDLPFKGKSLAFLPLHLTGLLEWSDKAITPKTPLDTVDSNIGWIEAGSKFYEAVNIICITAYTPRRSPYTGLKSQPLSSKKVALIKQQFDIASKIPSQISGSEVFLLYDTYGFPKELTDEIAAESGLSIDSEGFEQEMERQRERARAAQKVGFVDIATRFKLEVPAAQKFGFVDIATRFKLEVPATKFVGYECLRRKTQVTGLIVNKESVKAAEQGQEIEAYLSETPFYGEMGGQVGDIGEIRGEKGRITVTNTVRHIEKGSELIIHQGKVVEGQISVNDEVEAIVGEKCRLDIARNHTATHLLQASLRQVLGTQVQQAGSLVAPDRLRFDFTYLGSPTREQLTEVQRIVNERVRQNLPVRSRIIPYREAIAQGALAFFGEKYGEDVRVLEIGDPAISTELCGGTHVNSTGEIGLFLIIDESSIGAGMRRIEAVTGRGAEELVEAKLSLVEETAQELRVSASEIKSRISALQTELDAERKRALSLERELQRHTVDSLLNKAESIAGVTVLAAKVSASNMESLRYMGDLIKERLGSVVVVLGAVYGNQANFVAMVTPDLVAKELNAGQIAKQVAAVAGGSGGGRAALGQAGGKDKRKIDDALRLVRRLVESKG
ncbi:MAG: alanine--tRNA ligase, partial [Chloroflexi bacterium]|nr:alanine--tRNA ligase [Chloroflexota bacterium]